MKKGKIDLVLMIIGIIGLVVIAIISIVDSFAQDIISAIPVQILFASLFISGYVSYRSKD